MIRWWRLFIVSLLATAYAIRKRAPGMQFAVYGRRVALMALTNGNRDALPLLLTPVSIVRYWEFPFVLRHLDAAPQRCLDVASPRLLSYYVASHVRSTSIRVINPDVRDAAVTAAIGSAIGLRSLSVDSLPVSAIAGERHVYDAIWSVSVVEHISDDGDSEAMRSMYDALKPGGRLLVTVPVDRHHWSEFRDHDPYGLGLARGAAGYFFQRWYDEASVHARLIEPLEAASSRVEWFGERVPGRFAAYERDWQLRGHRRTASDPREIADSYRSYPSWSDMVGQGVCGIAIVKPA